MSANNEKDHNDPILNDQMTMFGRAALLTDVIYNTYRCQNSLSGMDDDENQFVVDDVSKIINDTIEATIGGNIYQQDKVNQWSATVSEQCLSALSKLKKSFKYVVTCSIMQKTGAGLHTASSCYWDSATDGTCTVRWENKTMYCIVSVFGLAI
ncbi:t-complex-associated-testis-expressed 1/ dynein light chain [Holotrichia oblita]|uniref:T-complex-associated-testis-expressed 1/ dynein light chain n=2 Tax=Holotrichia oblita TaxID=644536 RepID=A0ACB9TZ03_HOLOL|nr:t-complex-associated-testis-expressed 1/ dynein light chain [Holotrichia oblita]KAI4471997.1 t-complex-associated-testis-expressed 1/ dynein light chain [Holotrichia oblita]